MGRINTNRRSHRRPGWRHNADRKRSEAQKHRLAFLDYDRDGNLELFIANCLEFDVRPVYRVVGTFCITTVAMARSRTSPQKGGDSENTWHIRTRWAVFDFDDDGWPDIYLANDSTSSAYTRTTTTAPLMRSRLKPS